MIPATYHITTFGCPKNLVDSEIVAQMLETAGWRMVHDPLEAVLLVVNTCAFVDDAQEESLEALVSAVALKHEAACRIVVASGCLVQRYGHELSRQLPDVDLLIGVRDFPDLVAHVDSLRTSRLKRRLYRSKRTTATLYDRPRLPLEARHIRYLKIAEGCDCTCGFCTIPSIRGPQQSRPLSALVTEAQTLLSAGARELIVIAQDTTFYGVDTHGHGRLPVLLGRLSALVENPHDTWIRVLYLQPFRVTTAIIAAMGQAAILPYFDLAIQHSSPKVLRAMRRPVPPHGWEPLVETIRAAHPEAVIRASILVGHPGESDDSFLHLVSFLQRMRLDRVGVFVFSPQHGTPSADRKAPAPEAVTERLAVLNSLLAEHATEQFQQMLGRTYRFIVDGPGEHIGNMAIRPWFDAPQIDWLYTIQTKPAAPGAMIDGRVVGGRAGDVVIDAV